MTDLKSYFHDKYQGGESFIENIILPIFGEDKYEDAYEEDVLENNPELTRMADTIGISQILRLGTIDIPMNPTDVFDITVSNHVQMERNRVTIQQLVRGIMSTYSSAFMVFHYNDETRWDWRFTFCSKQGSNQESTDSKRYTFLLGPNQSCRTAAENFKKLASKRGAIELKDIVQAFDIEALSDEFFEKYETHYKRFVEYIADPSNEMRDNFITNDFDHAYLTEEEIKEAQEKPMRDYVKKLLGRIVFLHYLQKKGWMGVPDNDEWGKGDSQFMLHLFERATESQKDNFLDEILEPLFQNALDKDRTNDDDLFDTKVDGFRNVKIPYLNGGLFERDSLDELDSVFPQHYFKDLLDFLHQYNFTIDENDPDDAQIGVDPEMLGRIFENLLEDNKNKGAYYTPKYVVQFMCKESLITYLQSKFEDEVSKESVREFVKTYNGELLNEEQKLQVIDNLKTIKICDPAIGSGAFPMGLMRELYFCRCSLENHDNAVEIKKHIIQQNIYGVDIEKGAVDIARLRFWLSLVVDEETPHALPNIDFKIMQGNSLLEQYKGVDLSDLNYHKTKKEMKHGVQLSFFDNAADYTKKQFAIKMNQYFGEKNHTERTKLRKGIKENVEQQLRDLEYNVDLSDIKDICATSEFFLWHTWFMDVFANGGFDIVIGNPPYIRQERLGIDYKRLLTSIYPNVGNGIADIYVYFFALGIKLLKDNGVLMYITLNKYLKTLYGKELRNTLANEVATDQIIDFFELPVFRASTDAAITKVVKCIDNRMTKYYPIYTLEGIDLMSTTEGRYKSVIKNESEWQFVEPEEISVLDKIYEGTVSLKEFTGNRLFYGVKTGLNKAFVLKEKSIIDKLLASESCSIIKKYVQPTDIHKWRVDTVDNYIVGTYPAMKLDIEAFPTLKDYLLTFGKEKLEQTGKSYIINGETVKARKKTNNKWFEVQDSIAYWREFDLPKIIYIHTAKNHEFYLDTEGYHINNSCFMIGSDNRFLFCFLNSKLFSWFKRKKFVAYGDGENDGRCKLDANKMITVPIKANVDENPFAEIVDRVKEEIAKNPNYDTTAEEREIDRLVYDLYGLTEDEIKIVEGSNR